ncbi:MAG: glycosyltransferase family 2 protein [Oscillospiraceae bacterium]|nr:glycosyltransferase family 2 protein [Oscillospiraceae bacterium]
MPEEKTLAGELRRLARNAEALGGGGGLGDYIRYLNELSEKPERLFAERYRPIVEAEAESEGRRPFLSVITRTQGRRPDRLRDMLLSLAAQTDEDFELLLIGHRLDEPGREELLRCLEELPRSLRERIRFFELAGGNRTAPLNLGFAHARGAWAAVLDDDDLVFEDWVERFHSAAGRAPGRILHAWVATQKWELLPDGRGLRSAAAPGAECCAPFHFARQLNVNLCPLLGLAFPTVWFREWGLIFDESLSTTEDWDYLMRLAPLAGVTDVPYLTGLYRLWLNADTSQAAHPKPEWEANYERIREKFRRTPMLFPAGAEKWSRPEPGPPPLAPRRLRVKDRCRRFVPRPLWRAARRLYRALGGRKWLG